MTLNNPVYPKAKEAFLQGLIDVLGDDIVVQAFDDDFVYSDTDEFLADVTGTAIGAAVQLTGIAVTAGQVTADTPLTFAWPGGSTVIALVVLQDTGNSATSRLIALLDEKADGTNISIVTDGSTIDLHWIDPYFSIGG